MQRLQMEQPWDPSADRFLPPREVAKQGGERNQLLTAILNLADLIIIG